MKDAVGILYAAKDEFGMRELTANRSVTALPVAARYRLVDFLMSNLVNSGVRKVGVLAQGYYRSLIDHMGSGKEWNLHTRNNGLYFLTPMGAGNDSYPGFLDAMKANAEFLRRSTQKYVLIVGGRLIYNTRFDDMIEFHEQTGADVTLMYTRFDPMAFDYSGQHSQVRTFVNVNAAGRITDMEINPNVITYPNILMDVVLIKRTLLMHLTDIAAARGYHSLYADILRGAAGDESLNVMGYEFKGYCRPIETIRSYYNMNMDLLRPEVRRELFGVNPVFTKTRDDPPTKYMPGAEVADSLIADGCVLEGGVTHSVLFRGVHIAKGARVSGCIIMQDCEIGEDVILENVILDKNVTMLRGARVIGPRQYPMVLGKNVTV